MCLALFYTGKYKHHKDPDYEQVKTNMNVMCSTYVSRTKDRADMFLLMQYTYIYCIDGVIR